MDVGGYRHNYEGFYEKFTYQMFINNGRTTITHSAHASRVRIFFFFSLVVKSFKRRSNYPKIVWIPLEARTPSRQPYKHVFPYILDDMIICSWCVNI